MPRLSAHLAATLAGGGVDAARSGPERVLQVGSGHFLRAFAGWMVDRMNRRGLLNGRIVVAQATPSSRTAQVLNEQEGLYTVLSRGLRSGEPIEEVDLVRSVSRAVNPSAQWRECLALAASADLRFVVSNTTEAGIVYASAPPPENACPPTFPAQLAALLHERYRRWHGAADRGLIVLPCELIDDNARTLRRIVLQHAADWHLEAGFADWLNAACRFAGTLVDRIVPGHPAEEMDGLRRRLGYDDRLLVAAEWYHSWVIEGDADLARQWPLADAGLNVTWTDDLEPFRRRKVRILNGLHTVMAAPALLADVDTVRDGVDDPLVGRLVRRALTGEILPAIGLPGGDAAAFGEEVLNRFGNPYIRHRLADIALNGVSKWRVRVLPSIEAFLAARRLLPPLLTFSLAALLALYRGERCGPGRLTGRRCSGPYEIAEEPEILAILTRAWSQYHHVHDLGGLCRDVLASPRLWDRDLNDVPGLADRVAGHLDVILQAGMVPAIQAALYADR